MFFFVSRGGKERERERERERQRETEVGGGAIIERGNQTKRERDEKNGGRESEKNHQQSLHLFLPLAARLSYSRAIYYEPSPTPKNTKNMQKNEL